MHLGAGRWPTRSSNGRILGDIETAAASKSAQRLASPPSRWNRSLHCTIHPEVSCLATGRGIGNYIGKNIGNLFGTGMSFSSPMLLIYKTFFANLASKRYRQK